MTRGSEANRGDWKRQEPGVLGDGVADWKGGEVLVWSAGGIGAEWGSWGSQRPGVLEARLGGLGEVLPWYVGVEWGKRRKLGGGSGLESWGAVGKAGGSTELGRNGTAGSG